MDIVRLRVMTQKSLIGFGFFPELTVGELIKIGKYKDLLSMYYNLEKIDFNQDVKDILGITKGLEILKPGKNNQIYRDNIYNMVSKLYSTNRNHQYEGKNAKTLERKQQIAKNAYFENSFRCKIKNRNSHQK